LLKGTDLAKALSIKPGPWMKDALDVVMAWQLRNPSTTDPAEAIEAVKKARESDSELPQRLASHFLKLTIPPFFPQTKSTNTLEQLKERPPWKDPHNAFVQDLLGWCIMALDRKAIEQNWHLLVPPILKMLDDPAEESKAKGCQHLASLLLSLHLDKEKSTTFLARTGYHDLVASTLFPLFTHIPTLTPEPASLTLFNAVYDPLINLSALCASDPSRIKFLDRTMREGVLAPLSHFPTPSTYPHLASSIFSATCTITTHLGIETVKHLPSLVPLVTGVMQDPFVLAHKGLALAVVKVLQALVQNCWPRMAAHRGAVVLGLCVLRGRVVEEMSGTGGEEELSEIQAEVKDTAELLDAVLSQSEVKAEWEREKEALVQADEGLRGFFEGSAGGE
jgi:tRNA nucleotidyltransferase (CCA-adding enzyme)